MPSERPSHTSVPRVGVFHPGTQRFREVSVTLQEAGLLEWCATGVYFKPDKWPYTLLGAMPGSLRQRFLRELRKRRHDKLDDRLVLTNGKWEWALAVALRHPALARFQRTLMEHRNEAFGTWLSRHECMNRTDLVYGFNTCSVELFREAKAKGMPCVLDQTNPYAGFCARNWEEEAQRTPQFGRAQMLRTAATVRWYATREQPELAMADAVVIGSRFAAETLGEAGVDLGKCRVVGNVATVPRVTYSPRPAGQRIRLLFAGVLNPMKGIYYLLEAMKRLDTTQVELLLVGRLDIPERALAPYRHLFTYIPQVPREQLYKHYANTDIFVLPTIHEGFARVLVEAAAMGCPIVTTTASGTDELIGDEEAGYQIAPRDIDGLAEKIDQLCGDRQLREQMGRRAWERAAQFTPERYAERLVSAVLGAWNDSRQLS